MAFGKVLAQVAIHNPRSRNLFPFCLQRASRLRNIERDGLQQPVNLTALPVIFHSLASGLNPIPGQDAGPGTNFGTLAVDCEAYINRRFPFLVDPGFAQVVNQRAGCPFHNIVFTGCKITFKSLLRQDEIRCKSMS